MLGVHVEAGPSTQEIIAALERCEWWSRDDRKRLAYLAIFTGYIEGRKYSTPTRVSLARLVMVLERFENSPLGRVAFKVYTALPELGATFGNPLPNNLSPPILAYKGNKGRRQFKEAILSQTRVINFVQKDIVWSVDVDRLYIPICVNQIHWISICVNLVNRTIDVFDCGGKKNNRVIEAFAVLIPRIVKAVQSPERKKDFNVKQYTVSYVPMRGLNMSGNDCGAYSLKFIECHLLGLDFSLVNDENIKEARHKIAFDLWEAANDAVLQSRMSTFKPPKRAPVKPVDLG
ncbi:hypothetical protein F2Q70_00012896 [Brassica cretica]|uniref:Ubiquitin-like protease family profile domain-containing protein n=1 Tax=Brassica cretica TaxID=69181 RepID=A0A8S9M0N3_BRACR|nr:hypothetical protein F2Q70_00012896 [Brassica cretica]